MAELSCDAGGTFVPGALSWLHAKRAVMPQEVRSAAKKLQHLASNLSSYLGFGCMGSHPCKTMMTDFPFPGRAKVFNARVILRGVVEASI